jgi:deoxyribonucleoside regulator
VPAHDVDALLVRVAQLYYEQGLTQAEIGAREHLTRWKIGRLLEEARAVGIVRITIVHPQARRGSLEAEIQRRFGMSECVVVPSIEGNPLESVGRAAADLLHRLGPDLRTLGVSWGNTIDAVAQALPRGWNRGVEVIQINGSVSRSITPTTAVNAVNAIATKGAGRVTLLPVPAIVEHAATRAALETEGFVAETLQRAARADALLFSLGVLDDESVLVRSGAVTEGELLRLRAANACGDVLGHFLDSASEIADDDLEARVIGLGLDDLAKARCSIGVAGGHRKADIIRAALRRGILDVLVTDEDTARHVLED